MTHRLTGAAIVALVAVSACTPAGPGPDPSGTASVTASPTPSPPPRATGVACRAEPVPLTDGVRVGGLTDASPATLQRALDAQVAPTQDRRTLTRDRAARARWRDGLVTAAAGGPLVMVIQLGDIQREAAQAVRPEVVVLVLPRGSDLATLAARYPDALLVTTGATQEDEASLTDALAEEVVSILRRSLRCAAIAAATATPTATASPGRRCGPADARRPIRFVVRIGSGVRTSAPDLTAALLRTYCDPNGWLRSGVTSFTTASSRTSGVTLIRLEGRAGVREHCTRLLGEQASGNYSCASHAANEIVLNNTNWENGTPDFLARGGTLTTYRQMVATHEMGHVLDLRHQLCRTDGAPAPVMMQQSISMTSDSTGKTCEPNPWPVQHEIDRLRRRWT